MFDHSLVYCAAGGTIFGTIDEYEQGFSCLFISILIPHQPFQYRKHIVEMLQAFDPIHGL